MSNSAAQADSAIATYRVLRELGRRSQRSYLAVRGDGSSVVLHRFTRDAKREGERVTAEQMAILLRDARCLAKNWHPNLAQVRHVDLAFDTLHVGTELLDGVTLEELLSLARAKRARPDEPVLAHAILARIFLDVLSGLGALHGLRDGISTPLSAFHGELCPANVVIGKDGVARIVSIFRPRPVMINATSEALGYAPPETLAGEVEQDGRVDVYAVGVMLWEALTDRRLYDEVDPSRIAQRQREDDIPRPEARLADIAMRALSFDPALRFRTAQDMAARIRSLAGTIAQGSVVAQTVTDLAGDAIRSRRAALASRDGSIIPAPRSRPPRGSGLPEPTRSGTLPRASAPAFEPEAPTIPKEKPAIRASAPTPSDFDDETPSVPPVLANVAAMEMRIATPSAPDLETAYAPRPLPARRPADAAPALARPASRPPFPAHSVPLPGKATVSSLPPDDDDDLPGPRQSTPDDEYLAMLAAEARTAQVLSSAEELLESDAVLDDDDGSALMAAREIVLSERSIAPTSDVVSIPPSARPPPHDAPAQDFPAVDQLTAPLAATPPAPPLRAEASEPRERSTRTPFVVGVVPQQIASPGVRADRRLVPVAVIAVAALLAIVIGAALLSSGSQTPDPAAATVHQPPPPSTVVVAPPPIDPPASPSSNGAAPAGTPTNDAPADRPHY
jgi:serine/threonine protein kinase